MDRETLNLVIVGHVDHGKSTLIGRLLFDTGSLPPEKMEEIRRVSKELGHDVEFAYVMDHLEEERKNEMTIDTTQAFFKTAKRDYVIIDAPGHKELMKNMVTGASQAQVAVLVVDAAEGLREQTQRHAYFLGMLGIRQVAVLINKMDKVEFAQARFNQLVEEAGRFLKSVGVTPSYFIPGSAMKGDNIGQRSTNMNWYTGPTVLEVLDKFETAVAAPQKALRFPIQDVYSQNGNSIFVGRVESGRLAAGQELLLLPSGAKVTVKEILKLNEKPTEAVAEECIGVILEPKPDADRGEVGCPVDDPATPTRCFRANVFWMAQAPCKLGNTYSIRSATQDIPCRIKTIEKRIDSSTLAVIAENAKELAETEVGQVILEAQRPIVLETVQDVPELGRIVIARGMDVVGGGLVTHATDAHL